MSECLTCGQEMQSSRAAAEYFGDEWDIARRIQHPPRNRLDGLPMCILCLNIAYTYSARLRADLEKMDGDE